MNDNVLIVLGIIGLIIIFNTFRSKPVDNTCERPGKASTHKWTPKAMADDNGYLVCAKCGKQPGYEK